jgi:hypothetical protein
MLLGHVKCGQGQKKSRWVLVMATRSSSGWDLDI